MKSLKSALALTLVLSNLLPATAFAQQPQSILGKTDVHGLLEAVPGMPSSTTEAATRAYGPDIRMYEMPVKLDSLYDPFFKRAGAAHQQLKDGIAIRMKSLPDKTTVEKQAKAQVNSNPIVSGMGGIDQIQQMTPAQREAAARQSVAGFQQNLVTGGGRNSPTMQAMMQKVMSDPAYRARFMQMSEQEKEAELRKNMGTPQAVAQSPAQQQQAQQRLQANNEIADSMALQNELRQMAQRLGEIDAAFVTKDQAISKAPGSHEDIGHDIAVKISKVPVVELGEYGRDRDPEKVGALLREQATRDRDRAVLELKQRGALYTQRKAQYKELASAYDIWLKQNIGRINTSMANPLSNTNTELAVAGYEDVLITMSENLAKYSEEVTKEAARYERNYQEKLSNQSAASAVRPTKAHN